MEDLAVDETSAAMLTTTLAAGKPLGIVCHAPAACWRPGRPAPAGRSRASA